MRNVLFTLFFIAVTLLPMSSYANQYTDALAPPLVLTGGPRSEVRNNQEPGRWLTLAEAKFSEINHVKLTEINDLAKLEALIGELFKTDDSVRHIERFFRGNMSPENKKRAIKLRLLIIAQIDFVAARILAVAELDDDSEGRSELRQTKIDKLLDKADNALESIYLYPFERYKTVEDIEDLFQLLNLARWNLEKSEKLIRKADITFLKVWQVERQKRLIIKVMQTQDQIHARLDEIIQSRSEVRGDEFGRVDKLLKAESWLRMAMALIEGVQKFNNGDISTIDSEYQLEMLHIDLNVASKILIQIDERLKPMPTWMIKTITEQTIIIEQMRYDINTQMEKLRSEVRADTLLRTSA